MSAHSSYPLQRLTWLAIGLIVSTWAVLYLPHLRTSPSWYGDETATFLIGRELFGGQSAIGAIKLTHWHPYYPYQPGYGWLVGMFGAVTGGDILGGRFFNTLLALATALSICLLGRWRFGLVASAFGAFMFLTYQQSVIHFRWVYPHNMAALGFTLMGLFLLRPSRAVNNWRAGLGLGLAALAHPLFSYGAVAGFLCRLKRPYAWLPLAIPSTLVLLGTWAFISWRYWPESWLLDDLGELAKYYSGDSSQDSNLFLNLWHFYTQDAFHIGSALALLLCIRRQFYPIAICGGVLSVCLLSNRQNLTLFYYQATILLPFFGLAWAGALSTILCKLRKHGLSQSIRSFLQKAVFLVPAVYLLTVLPSVLSGKIIPRNHLWTTQNVVEVEAAARWLNERTTAKDLVVANVNLAWLLNARTADFIQTTLWQEVPTEYFPEGISRKRFRYPADLKDAKYVVLGDIDQIYMLRLPNVMQDILRANLEKWPIAWSGETYTILANPALDPPR